MKKTSTTLAWTSTKIPSSLAVCQFIETDPVEDRVRREPSTVSLLHNLTIAKRNTPFAQFESGLSTGVKHE